MSRRITKRTTRAAQRLRAPSRRHCSSPLLQHLRHYVCYHYGEQSQQLSWLVPCEGHSRSARGKGESRLLRRRGKLTHSRLDALSTRSDAQTSAQGRAEGRAQVAAPLIRKRASGERSRHRIKLFIATCSCLYTPPIFYDWLSRRFRRSSSCRSSSLLSSSPSSTSSGGEPDHTPMRKEGKTNRTMSV